MTMLETAPARLAGVLDGFPHPLLPRRSFDRIVRLTLDLDALGRVDAETDAPLMEPHTLRAALCEAIPAPLANRLVDVLAALPGAAFVRTIHPPAREVPWFELAERVVIYDADPGAGFHDLPLPAGADTAALVAAVQRRFPSLESELLEPGTLPPRIRALLEDGGIEPVLRSIARQLGWWAALAAVLLVPGAAAAEPGGAENAWPLSMFVACAAVGGWTLTVVGSCILAPVD